MREGAAVGMAEESDFSEAQGDSNGFDVFGEKTRLSVPAKLAVVAKGLVR